MEHTHTRALIYDLMYANWLMLRHVFILFCAAYAMPPTHRKLSGASAAPCSLAVEHWAKLIWGVAPRLEKWLSLAAFINNMNAFGVELHAHSFGFTTRTVKKRIQLLHKIRISSVCTYSDLHGCLFRVYGREILARETQNMN